MPIKKSMEKNYKISDVSKETGLSADTLRYYEKIGLLKNISRMPSGVRIYSDTNLSILRFIQRAKTMNFTLDEIADLLQMRENPARAKKNVRQLTQNKLDEVEQHLKILNTLRNELTLLVNLCAGSDGGCPIIDGIDQQKRE
ncbi:Transcriptional regulator, MerR family [hydrothermal vent metagenome]|uniref:Transcriptional regulator, MerR family n=1 Tax=hydrothermal vent metagenome TaxID=652676 RepID=A0A3B0XAG3_9ZZZZ